MWITLPDVPRIRHAHATGDGRSSCNDAACPQWVQSVARSLASRAASGNDAAQRAILDAPSTDENVAASKRRALIERMEYGGAAVRQTPNQTDGFRHALKQIYKADTKANLSTRRAWAKSRKHGGVKVIRGTGTE